MENVASRCRRLILLLFLLALPLVPAWAQTPGRSLQIVGVDTSRPEHLEFLLTLPDDAPARDAGEFRLLEDGQETGRASSVQPFRPAGWSLSTVVAVDTSGSVRRYLREVAATLPEFILQHPPQDAFAVVTFDDEVTVVAPFGTPRDEVRASLAGIQARGRRTLLYSALERGIATLDAVPRARAWRRLIVISDGADESGDQPTAADAIIGQAAEAAIIIDTIWIGQPVASTRNTLIRLAERTGGVHSDVTNPERLADDLRRALARATARVNQTMAVAFDRRVQPGARTSQVAVSMAREGVAPASLALQVPRSAPVAPPPPPPDRFRWVRLLTRLALALVLGVFGYAAVRVIVFKQTLREVFVIWPHRDATPDDDEKVEETLPPVQKLPRHTVVGAPAPFVAAGNAPAPLILEAIEGPLMGQRIPVPGPRFQIGAAKTSDLRIASDKFLSGTHALIQTSRTGWMVVDKGSSNGTYLDGRKIGTTGQEVRDGQRLRVGGSEFRLVLGTAGARQPAAPAASAESEPR